MIALYLLAGAFLFRLRGGFLPLGTTHGARAVYAAGMAGLVFLLTFDPWTWLLVPAFWMGCLFGDAPELPFGRRLLRGLWWTLPAGAGLYVFGGEPWFAAVGLLKPFLYEIAERIPSKIRHLNRGMEIGEALFGAGLGAALWLAVK